MISWSDFHSIYSDTQPLSTTFLCPGFLQLNPTWITKKLLQIRTLHHELFAILSADSIGDNADVFTKVLDYQPTTVDVGQAAFNQMFWDSDYHILKSVMHSELPSVTMLATQSVMHSELPSVKMLATQSVMHSSERSVFYTVQQLGTCSMKKLVEHTIFEKSEI